MELLLAGSVFPWRGFSQCSDYWLRRCGGTLNLVHVLLVRALVVLREGAPVLFEVLLEGGALRFPIGASARCT